MSDHYEFEEAKNHEKEAKGVITTLLSAVLGLGIAAISSSAKKNQERENAQTQSRINDLEAKPFKTSAQKEELKSLREKINK